MRYKLRMRRIAKGLTQAAMAEQMNKHTTTWSRIESGQSAFAESDIIKASEILGCRPEELMDNITVVQSGNGQANTGYIQHIAGGEGLEHLSDRFIKLLEEKDRSHEARMAAMADSFCNTIKELVQGIQNKA